MSNLKKILALVLALVMSFSLVSVSSAAFTDADAFTANYEEAVDVLSGLGVIKGYDNGSFNPQGNISRAEAAAIIYRVVTGDVADKHVALYAEYGKFEDVAANNWAAGYIGYCANGEYIKGYNAKTFGPKDNVTGYQMLAMLLRAMGYGKNGEFSGDGWDLRVATVAESLGLLENVVTSHAALKNPATRELVCELVFSAMTKADMVTYNMLRNYYSTGKTLGQSTFNMEKVAGVVEAVGRAAGTTTLGTVKVTNTNTSWESIGYLAYVWARPTAGAKTFTAITDVKVIGDSLLVSHDGTPFGALTPAAVVLDSDVEYYYNGVKLAAADVAAKTALVAQTGVKVDFIDNDFMGKAEAVVITDYTVDYVTGIANDYNTGANAIVKNYTYFQNAGAVKTANVVTADTLAVGDLVTYVKYAGDYYTVKAPVASGIFTKINYANVVPADYSYVIGGNEYYLAEDFDGNYALLGNDDINTSLSVYTDPYGYAIKVAPNTAAAQYLFVVRTNHSDNVAGTTYATVAFADGTIENVYVAPGYAVGSVNDFGDIETELYTYVAKDGIYYLTSECEANAMNHVTTDFVNTYADTVELETGAYFTKSSVVVDLRAVMARLGGVKVYNGYAQIPSIDDGVFHYVKDANGFIKVAFLVGGLNIADLSKEFILYHTGYNYYTTDELLNTYYVLNAIVDGKIAEVKLTAAQYADVQKYGVGLYQYSYTGALNYVSFVEGFNDIDRDGDIDRSTWSDVIWQDGTIVVDGRGYAYGEAIFFTLDIAKGKAYDFIMNAGLDMTDAKACVRTNKYNTVTEIYIVYGELSATEGEGEDHGLNTYYAEAGKVTNFTVTGSTLSVLAQELADLKAEVKQIEALVNAYELSIFTAETMTYPEALARLASLKDELENLVAQIEALIENDETSEADVANAEALLEDAETMAEAVAEAQPVVAVAAKLAAVDMFESAKTVAEKAAAQAALDAANAALTEIGDDLDDDLADMLEEIEDVEIEEVTLVELVEALKAKDFKGMTVEFVYDVEEDVNISSAFFAALWDVLEANEIIANLHAVAAEPFRIGYGYHGSADEIPEAGEESTVKFCLKFYVSNELIQEIDFEGTIVNATEIEEDAE